MAYSYVWPLALPTSPLTEAYSESCGPNILSTNPDQGPAKLRRLSKLPDPLSVTMAMTSSQVTTFESFVNNTLLGVARFGFTHPRKESIVEARFVPLQGGKLYTIVQKALGLWSVSFTLEVMP